MKIKTMLQLFFLLSTLIAAGLVSVVFLQKNNMDRMINKEILANEIVKVVNQRENIINDYINYHKIENIILWQLMYEITVKLLQSKVFDTPEEQAILEGMREDNVTKNKLFTELVILEQKNQPRKKDHLFNQEMIVKIKFQLSKMGESIITGAYRLSELNRKNIKSIVAMFDLFFICSIVTLITFGFLILILLRRTVDIPLSRLNEGIKIIGAGDLDYKIGPKPNNEVGEIINSFNEMAHNLKNRITELQHISTKLEKSNRANLYIAQHDLLTNLPNKALSKIFLQNAIVNARNTNTIVAVIDVDLDYFKRINDTIGHIKADRLLKETGRRLQKVMRNNSDLVARFSGNEFCIIIPWVKYEEEVAVVAEKVLNAIAKPFSIDNKEFYLTASIGISLYPFDGDEVSTLIEQADFAMYQAKNAGRNNIQFAFSELREIEKKKGEIEVAMYHAIVNNKFILYYQPIVNTKTKNIVGMEALIRWINDEGKIISPQEFISIAERSDLVILLGEWVLETACKQFKEWQQYGLQTMAVNISVHQLSERLLKQTENILKDLKLAKGSLIFEITETILMQQTDVMFRFNKILTEMGVSLSIDDFGTGYSSFTYLNKFNISNLKLDMSFIKDVNKDRKKAAIVKAILQMAHTLNIKTIAEGLETKGEFEFLEQNDCDECQGFYFSKPLPPNEIVTLLQRNLSSSAST